MNFAWAVPAISAYAIWTERKKLAEDFRRRNDAGPMWEPVLGFVAVLLFGVPSYSGSDFHPVLGMIGTVGLLFTTIWAVFGWRMARDLAFPVLFLAFVLPFDDWMAPHTGPLRRFLAEISTFVLNGISVESVRNGTVVTSYGGNPFSFDVAGPCAGVRSIVALLAVTSAWAWFEGMGFVRGAALFAWSVPLAILGNAFRIVAICLVAVYYSPECALGRFHDAIGYAVFLSEVFIMVALGEALKMVVPGWKRGTET